MQPIERYFVALSPGQKGDENLLKGAAGVLGTDVYNVRLLLRGEMPRIVAQYQQMDQASALAKALTALGLAAIAGPYSDLHRSSTGGFMAQSLNLGENDVVFHDGRGESIRIGGDDAFLLLEGILVSGAENKETKTKKMLNLPITLLLGGIPVWRKSQTQTSPASENEHFLRFYRRTSSEAIVEIRNERLDYSFLGHKKGFSSTENFNSAINELRRTFPHAIYDDRLTRNSRAGISTAMPEEELEQNSRLIYLFYVAAQAGSSKD